MALSPDAADSCLRAIIEQLDISYFAIFAKKGWEAFVAEHVKAANQTEKMGVYTALDLETGVPLISPSHH